MSQTVRELKGSMAAIVTPMHAGVKPDAGIDLDALAKLVEFHVDNGTNAIVAVGTTGESATLPETEHCELLERIVNMVGGRIPVIAGTGANSTQEALRLTEHARTVGADACLLVTPYYNKPSQEGLHLHFRHIAENVDIPQIVYNVPSRTACDMQVETVARLVDLPNVIGIKEATGDLDRVRRLRELCGDGFLLFSGDDATACEFMLDGGDGVISVTANVAPHAMSAMCAAALVRDGQKARELDQPLSGLHKHLFIEANPMPVKWALHRMGLIQAGIRMPLTWLAEEFHEPLAQAMRQAGVLS